MSIFTLLRRKIFALVVLGFLLLFGSVGRAQINVTATAGTTSATYTTLRAAVLAINAGTHQGVINIAVTANTTETALSTLNQSGSGSSNYTSITIKPSASTTPVISGSVATGILYVLGSNVTIDGSNTAGGTSRDLTIRNTNTASSYVIRIASPTTTLGATNNTIKNCTLTNASSTGTGNVVISGSTTIYNPSDAPNSNNTIQNNAISGAQEGIYIYGSTVPETNWLITGNSISGCGFDGIFFWQATNFTISNNTISGISINGSSYVTGMSFSYLLSNGNIFGNNINTISNTSTTSYGTYGMYFDLSPATTNFNVYNNFVSNVICRASTTLSLNGHGVYMDYGGGLNFYHNTIDLTTNQTGTAANGKTAALCFDQVLTGGIPASSIKVKDNILLCNQTAGNRYGIYSTAANTIFNTIDYNDYYGATALGFLGSASTTIAQIQTGFGGNTNSITYNPALISTTDLHLTTAAANNVLAAGTPITTPSITTDIDGDPRSATTPTMGGDEIISNTITYTLLPATTCSIGDVALSGVSIVSGTGVPTTGTTVPQIYFRKNTGAWFHASGTLATGTGLSGTWNFTIAAATMGGVTGTDVISYYVIAQTTGGTVFSNPATGLVATDVNTVTTAPTTPNTYTVTAVSLAGLVTTRSVCYSPALATSATFSYTGIVSGADQYTLTWSPAGPTDVTTFTTLPASPITVSIPGGTAANTYTGTLTIKNSTTGCTNTYTLNLTVTAPPPPITGQFTLCTGGATTTLTDATGGGTWTGGSTSVATITTAGMVTSVAVGTTIVTYTAPVTGCTDTAIVTVIGVPNPITGPGVVCVGGTITLSETTGGGAWSTNPASVATVDVNGVVYGASTGAVTVSYSMPSGCYVTYPVTVNAALPAITGPAAVCTGSTISLNNTATGGTWTSGTLAAATVAGAGTTGTVGGVASGSSIITYSTSVGCNTYKTITVNPLPSAIAGPSGVCVGSSVSLTNATTPGTWGSSGPAATATITAGGVVTGGATGSVTITYTATATGCYVTMPVTVNPLPSAITGASSVCENGATVSVADASAPGTWTADVSGNVSIDAAGTVMGNTAGAAMVTFTLPATGCYVTRAITVNPVPAAITGNSSVCLNSSTTLSDASGTGSWNTSNASVASIGAASGIVTGAGTGTATIIYTLPVTGCYASFGVTVSPPPAPIGGATTPVCSNGTITLTETTGGGSWNSVSPLVTVDPFSGAVSGVSAGTASVTYTVTSTGCYATANVVVIVSPAPITGTLSACEAGGTSALADATTPGTWSISAGGLASISSSGVVTGNVAGSVTVSYTRSNGCFVKEPFTINPLPAALTGTTSVCQNAVTTLSSASTGGTWLSGSPFIASVSSGGGVGGILPGTSVITYTLPTGCKTTASVTVNAIPGTIIGNNYVCLGGVSSLSDAVTGGTWTSSAPGIASVESSTGILHGLVVGSATISYATGTSSCYAVLPISVNGIVSPTVALNVSPSATVCDGSTVTYTPTITNGGSAPLYVWSVNNMILSGASSYSYVPADADRVRLWIVSSYSCAIPDTASAFVDMTVHPNVTPGLSLSIAGGDTVCTGALTVVNAVPVSGGSAPTYQWSLNLLPVAAGPTYPFMPHNGDVITVTMTSNAPCRLAPTASAIKLITVHDKVLPMVSMTESLGLTTCEGYPETFTASQVNGGWSPTYQWSVNGVNTVTGTVFTYAPTNADNVQVIMTSSYPCLLAPADTTSNVITVLPITQPVGVVTSQPGYIVPEGMYDTFTCTILSGGGIAPLYQWYINNVPQSGATNPVYATNNLHTGDSVNCQVTNTDQCSGVSVFNSVKIIIGNNVGVHEVVPQGANIALLPNPNNGSFSIKGTLGISTDEELTLEITNMLGQKVYTGKVKASNGELNERMQLNNSLANGVYLLNVQSEHVNKTFHFVLEN